MFLSDLASAASCRCIRTRSRPSATTSLRWNNRPAPDWAAADGNWGFSSSTGPTCSRTSSSTSRARSHDQPVELVQIMEQAGLSDLRGTHMLPEGSSPRARREIGPREAQMIATLQDWVDGWTDFANARGRCGATAIATVNTTTRKPPASWTRGGTR